MAESWTELSSYDVDEPGESSCELFIIESPKKSFASTFTMAEYMAAETIQQAFKRYKECKSAFKIKRISSNEKAVQHLAADLIKTNFLKSKSLRKSKAVKQSTNGKTFPVSTKSPPRPLNSPNKAGTSEPVTQSRRSGTGSSLRDLFIEITNVKCSDLSNVSWNSVNDPYVELVCPNWKGATAVRWEGGSNVSWTHPGILVPVSAMQAGGITINVYSANVVREHQLIGSSTIVIDPSDLIMSSSQVSYSKTVSATIYDSSRTRAPKGNVSLVFVLREGEEYSLLEAKLAVEAAEQAWKLEEADIVRVELEKRRKEREVAASAATKRDAELARLDAMRKRQEAAMNDLTPSMAAPGPQAGRRRRVSRRATINQAPTAVEQKAPFKVSKEPVAFKPDDSKPETEPLYRVAPSISSTRPITADAFLQASLEKYPDLFQLNGEKKVLATSPPPSPPPQAKTGKSERRPRVPQTKVPEKPLDLGEYGAEPQKPPSLRPPSAPAVVRNSLITTPVYLSQPPPPPPPPPPPKPALVIDKAFENARKACCAIISLRKSEVMLLLKALDYPSTRHDADADLSTTAAATSLSLSLTSETALAAALEGFCRRNMEYFCGRASFLCTEAMATKALNNLNILIAGPWQKMRSYILKICKGTREGAKRKALRPSSWSGQIIQDFLGLLEIPIGNYSVSGADFLRVESFEFLFPLSTPPPPTVLVYRAKLYQYILRLLDSYWGSDMPRQRPHDAAENDLGAPYPSSSSVVSQSQSKRAGAIRLSRSTGITTSLLASEPQQQPAALSIQDEAFVKIASSDDLLHSFMSLNRAYSWKVPLDDITTLSSQLSGLIGRINLRLEIEEIKGAVWVDFYPQISGDPLIVSKLQTMKELRIVRLTSEGMERLRPISILLPKTCLFSLLPDEAPLAPIISASIGQQVTIAALPSLQQAVSRLDWYQRPTPAALAEIAGKDGEIISMIELDSTGCVGVEILLPRGLLVEGLPVESLRVSKALPRMSPRKNLPKNVPDITLSNFQSFPTVGNDLTSSSLPALSPPPLPGGGDECLPDDDDQEELIIITKDTEKISLTNSIKAVTAAEPVVQSSQRRSRSLYREDDDANLMTKNSATITILNSPSPRKPSPRYSDHSIGLYPQSSQNASEVIDDEDDPVLNNIGAYFGPPAGGDECLPDDPDDPDQNIQPIIPPKAKVVPKSRNETILPEDEGEKIRAFYEAACSENRNERVSVEEVLASKPKKKRPIFLKSYAWLHSSGSVFFPTKLPEPSPSSFEADGKEFVPVSRPLGLSPPRNSKSQGGSRPVGGDPCNDLPDAAWRTTVLEINGRAVSEKTPRRVKR